MIKRFLNGLSLFSRAYNATKHQIFVSMMLLLMVTMVFAILMWLAEGSANPDFGFWDALVWTFVKYVEDPADITSSPVTVLGQIVGTMVGVLGIAIFAVPAGLIGSGLMDAMDDEKHEQEIDEFKHRLHKVFRREANKSLRQYLNTLPDKGGEALKKLNFVPQFVPLSRIQIRQGMDLKDVHEVCQKYPQFRLKNLAEAMSDEDMPEDRFVLNTFPCNTSYGCCIDRGSMVTIVCPVGFSETGTGWFAYYMAKLGGFNYVCKELEVDPDELDSFFNMSDQPLYEKKTIDEYGPKDKHACRVIAEKQRRRQDFIDDLKRLNRGAGSWVIIMAAHLKSSENQIDFHFSSTIKDGSRPTVVDTLAYDLFYESFSKEMSTDFGLSSVQHSARYPLVSKSLAYRLQDVEGVGCNAFVLRPSTNLMIFDVRKVLYAYRMASIISHSFDNAKGMEQADIEDFRSTDFGFMENA